MLEILMNKKYQALANVRHHTVTNRKLHCLKVTQRALELYGGIDNDIIKAALLHDFYFNDQISCLAEHPYVAIDNAEAQGIVLSEEQKDIILSHMWPTMGPMPKTYKAWCVNVADKMVSMWEILNKPLW